MTLNSKEFVDTIIEYASGEGFPVDTDRQPNFWSITEKGGSFETRFSQMLCWYLSPEANHGLADGALNELFKELTRNKESYSPQFLNAKVLPEAYVVDLEKKGRYGRLDALVVDVENRTLIAIEVKMGAKDHENQLKKYYEAISQDYPDIPQENRYFVYLTPQGKESSQLFAKHSDGKEDWKNAWKPYPYSVLWSLVEKSLNALEEQGSGSNIYKSRIKNLLEDFYIIAKEKSSAHNIPIADRFIVGENNFLDEIACSVLALEIDTPARIRLRLNALKHKYVFGEVESNQSITASQNFWCEMEKYFANSNVTSRFHAETSLSSIIKGIWKVAKELATDRHTSADLEANMEEMDADGMSGVLPIARWLADTVRDSPNSHQSRKLMVEAQNGADKYEWKIGVGNAETKTIPKQGARRALVTFNQNSATIKLEPYGSSRKDYDHKEIRALCEDLFAELDDIIVYPDVFADRKIQININSSAIELRKDSILDLLKVTCFYR